MKIYVDVLVITNAVVTLCYIECICRITHEKAELKRELTAASVGGACSLIAAVETHSFVGALGVTLIKFGAVSAVIAIAFGKRAFIKRLFLYMLCDLLLGGVCFFIISVSRSEIVFIKNYTVYFDVSLFQIGICCAAVYGIISVYERIVRRRMNGVKKYRATYTCGMYEISVPAVSDTGNNLCDSFTGESVVIFRCDEMFSHYNLDRTEQLSFYGFHPVPYQTINGGGLIYVTSKGSVKISCKEYSKKVGCCVGILPSSGESVAIFNPALLI